MKLQHQIALAMRHRPLLLPMLLATVCLDAVLIAIASNDDDWGWLFLWGVIVPQLGLMSLWLGNGVSRLTLKFCLTVGFLAIVSVLLAIAARQWNDLAEIVTLLAGYAGAILVLSAIFNVAMGYLRPLGEPLRFSMWQMLVVTTLVALLSPVVRYADWPLDLEDLPILLGMIGAPVIAWAASRLLASVWQYTLVTLFFAGLFELAYFSEDADIHGIFVLPAVVCCGWLWALSVGPDSKRRMADRRRRYRIARVKAANLPPSELDEVLTPDPAPVTGLDIDA